VVGKQIKQERERQNMKLATLADEIGVAPSTLYRIETDQINITIEKLYRIAQALHVSIVDLIDEKYLGKNPEATPTDSLENRYIQFLKYQNDLLQRNHEKLQAESTRLMEICSSQDRNIKSLLAYLGMKKQGKATNKRKTKT
jgi:transcriptional regulator with XRE-family HTH domain